MNRQKHRCSVLPTTLMARMGVALTGLVLTAPALASGPSEDAATAAPPESGQSEVRILPPENYCLGGIDDRKIIVDESQIRNPFRQTTRLGCQVDGGQPRTMPDLPRPSTDHVRRV